VSERPSPKLTNRSEIRRAIAVCADEPAQGGLGPARQRDGEPALLAVAERLVVGKSQCLVRAYVPQLHHGFLQERQDFRLERRIGEELHDELRLDGDSRIAGGRGDRVT
jgi:hypothetical protein